MTWHGSLIPCRGTGSLGQSQMIWATCRIALSPPRVNTFTVCTVSVCVLPPCSHTDFLEWCERLVWMLLGLVGYKISQIKMPLNWLKLTFWILGILHNSRSGSAGLYCSSSWAIGLHLPWNLFLCEFIWIYGNELYRHICAWMEI